MLLKQQQQAIERLRRFKVGALFMQPGTGKTLAAYLLARGMAPSYILWLTPFQTKENLRGEIKKWGSMEQIEIVGIETLSSSDREYLRLVEKVGSNETCVICDESVKIKNYDAIRTQRIIELGRRANYRLVLNGTPITRNLLDIWAQMEFLSPKILNMNLAEFTNTFCEVVKVTKRVNGKRPYTREFIDTYHNVDYLYSLIHHYVFECDLELSIDREHRHCRYQLSEGEQDRYHQLKDYYLCNERLAAMNNNYFIEITQAMQHSYCCAEDKFSVLDKIIADHDPERVIVYCKYINSRDAVQSKYPGIRVLTYGKHALGLNLQHNNVTVYFDKTFDYAQMTQSEFRTYRTGQPDDCVYYRLTGNVGLESLIDNNINKKQTLLDYFKKVGAEQIREQL